MEQDMFEWRDEYKIGIPVIDDAHKRLFSIVSRILKNFADSDFEKNKMTCIEAIKYLKSYTVQHFAEEEAYQRSISYAGYENHKKVHDNMRDVVVPALEKEVTQSRYSMESMEHFAGACAGWLAAHILIEDQAIAGKTNSKWRSTADKNSVERLEDIIKYINTNSFNMPVTLVSEKYTGFELGRLFCYRDKFKTGDGEEYTVVSAIEHSQLDVILQKLMNKRILQIDDVMSPMVKEMFKTFNRDVMEKFVTKRLINLNSTVLPENDFYKCFKEVYPDYSTLWRADYGYIVFCVSKKS